MRKKHILSAAENAEKDLVNLCWHLHKEGLCTKHDCKKCNIRKCICIVSNVYEEVKKG